MVVGNGVLVIDDDHMIRDVVTRLLRLKKYQAYDASSGEIGLNFLEENDDIKFVILDLNMPGKYTGEETFYKIKKLHPDVKVVISTGYIEGSQIDKFKENGVFAILEKPYKIEDVITLLQ